MGARRSRRAAVLAAALLLFAARASASMVAEPIARLTLEGGYDSNALYDGRGGDEMGRISPDLGLLAKDHLWNLRASYGGDFLVYQRHASRGVWNHRGNFLFDAQPSPRMKLKATASGTYAVDPVGLARLGIFRPGSRPALILSGDARATWRASERLDLAGTYAVRDAHFDDGTGASLQAPGVEATSRITARSSLGGAYRFDLFQSATGPKLVTAHEIKAIYRYDLQPDMELVLEAGPTIWRGQNPTVLPEGSATFLTQNPVRGLRLSLRHGLSLGNLPTPGVTDGFEGGGFVRLGSAFRLRGTGGIWRSGSAPLGSNAVMGYALDGEFAWLVTRETAVAIGASRFARLDDPSPALKRTLFGLRFTWELQNR